MAKIPISRRAFLRAGGTLLALPALESLPRRFACASPAVSPPKRMVFLGFGYGVTSETWFPDTAQTGSGYTLSPGLAPLDRHKHDFSIIQGLSNKFNNEAHWGSTFWLTGANRYAEPGKSFHNSISVDQVAAGVLGSDTRFSSIQMGCENAEESGHGPGMSLAWDRHGKPIAGFDNPVVAFHQLFSDDDTPLQQRQAMLAQKRSVLDTVLADADSLRKRLAKSDADKLDEYYESIRDIESRLCRTERWLAVPRAKPTVSEPQQGLSGSDEIAVIYDLIVAALRTDTTRVATYRQPVSSLLKSLDLTLSAHHMSHYAPGERMEASQKRDRAQSELLAGLFDRMKSLKEPDGTSLFDNTVIVFGSNIRTIHYLDNCPTLVAGGGAGINRGQHIVLRQKDTPLCNLWLTLLKGIGVEVSAHGDSTGTLPELVA